MKKMSPILLSCLTLTACDTELEKTSQLCTTVENSRIEIDGTGFRDVISVNSGAEQSIGYVKGGGLTLHSECSAAHIDSSNSKYSWFEFGNKVEHDGVHSVEYYTNSSGYLSSKAERLDREGQWQEQYVENGLVTKQVWKNESLFDLVETVDRYSGDSIKESVITNGKLSKTKRYNFNTTQYDCFWDDDGSITSDIGCLSEDLNDISIFGIAVDSDFYIEQLEHAPITYELDENELIDDVRRYW
ncbi:hypothetical protein [Vibrio sp. THAF190c]|uniref:hypothetical protein n=1 Tax=Vibrio sp. THAF190c TaxID=2587865 RepID=UPI0012688C8F|nr:hypothetical protein [Vibrio sp. THAF190c]QFT13361.1 hypothetical protein FIV04_25760 [Vibrio sp. THAF190c]